MGESREDLQKRLQETGEVLRRGIRDVSLSDESTRQIVALLQTHATTRYAEAVVAVFLDALDSYMKAAEEDREAQAREREARALDREAEASARVERERERRLLAERDASHMAAQRRQGWIMVCVTVAIMISTVLYTIAAWKQAGQPSIQITAPVGESAK